MLKMEKLRIDIISVQVFYYIPTYKDRSVDTVNFNVVCISFLSLQTIVFTNISFVLAFLCVFSPYHFQHWQPV